MMASLSGDDCRLLIDSVIDYAIFMLDVDGCVASWNPGAAKINGYDAHEVVGEHFSKFYPPEDVAAYKPQRELEIAKEVGRVEDEGWRVRKDGTRYWANVVITALRDEHGTLRGFGKVTRDLSQKRAAEQELRHAEERFHHLVDAVIDYAIFMLDANGRVATWNPGAARLKGYSASEIIGQHFSVFYPAEDRAAGRPGRILDQVRREGRFEDEGWRVRKDGTRFWANVVISALRDESGAVVGFAKVTRDLTDRRRVEDDLRNSEERFRLLVDNVPDHAIYMLDVDGRVTTWNRGAERMKGYTTAEILGQSFSRFFPEDDVRAGKPARELSIALSAGRFEDEGWRVRKDGTRFWANAILTPLYDNHDRHIGFAKITRDLTARRAAEETSRRLLLEQMARELAEESENRIRESEERYRALSRRLEIILEGVADGITVQDRSGRVVFANSAAARLCGFGSVDELLQTSPEAIVARFEISDDNGRPVTAENFPARRLLAGEAESRAVLHVRERASRREWWSAVTASAVLGSDGEPELAINIWHDVTADRREDRQARFLADGTAALSSSLRYEEMLTSLTRVLVPGLADWSIVYLLERGELRSIALTHSDPAQLERARAYQHLYPPDPKQPRGVWNVLRTGTTELYNDIGDELLSRSSHDERQLELLRAAHMKAVLLVPIAIRGRGVGVLALVVTESERRYDQEDVRLVEELARRAGVAIDNAQLYSAAQEAARRADEASRAKDEFLATVSHELRTPLNAILGWATLLRDRVTEPSLSKPIETIYRNAQAQVRIVDDILDVSRVITGKFRLDPKPADLVAIARDAIEVVRPSAVAKKINIEFSQRSEFCLLVADPERLQQVVWNLLSNAVKFTDTGGTIELSVGQDGSNMILRVSDTGRGIDPEFLPYVFERFKQADSSLTRRVGGLGLGLALVRHIVELHGGRVAVSSEGLGRGATFTITLPIRAIIPVNPDTPLPPEVGGRSSAPPNDVALNGVRVLVVDDEPDARDLIATVLVQAGATVETARSVSEALELFKRFRPQVLVSDIGMPEEDGFSLIRRVRALPATEGGRIPSLALTAFAREEDRTRALSAGFTTHIGKPVNPDALTSAVANLSEVSSKPDRSAN